MGGVVAMYVVYIYNVTKQQSLEVEKLPDKEDEETQAKRQRIEKQVIYAQGGCDKEKFLAVFKGVISHLELAFLMIMQAFRPVYEDQQRSPDPKSEDEMKEMIMEQLRPALQSITKKIHAENGVAEAAVEKFANNNSQDPDVQRQITKLAFTFEHGVDLMTIANEFPADLTKARLLQIFEKIAAVNSNAMKKGVTQAHLDGRNVALESTQMEVQGEVQTEVVLQTKKVYAEYGLVDLDHLPEVTMQAGLMKYQGTDPEFARKIELLDTKDKRRMGLLLADLGRKKKHLQNKEKRKGKGKW
jgi:hypothetical protein